MAKEFEHYNDKFRHLQRTDAMEGAEAIKIASSIKIWGYEVERWIQADVQYAVYQAPDHEEWQKFRVSLKGQSTRMKLFRLACYWEDAKKTHKEGSVSRRIEKIRVDNYLGALVRGGQLNSKLEVMR